MIEIADAMVWLWRQPFLRATTIAVAASNLLFQALILVVIVMAKEQNASPTVVGGVLAGFGIGGVLGSLAAPWFQRRLSRTAVVIGAIWVWALALPWIALSSNLYVVGAILGTMAFVGPIWNVAIDSYRLLTTPDQLQGRVGSAAAFLGLGAIPLGSLLAGYLLDDFGPQATGLALSAAMLALACAATMSPAIRRASAADG